MGMLKEFREFAMRGNVVDLAVGVVIGTAFSAIVTSLVTNIIMPMVGVLIGETDFKSLEVTVGGAHVMYGMFIQAVVDFLIIAFAIFITVKLMNAIKKKEETAPSKPAEPTNEEKLLTEIRDILKNR
ncbi:MAG: large-conductance mechanosensitive channel protein MscL [Bacteroidota bacterium]